VRLQYVYPYPHVDEVIGLMTEGKVLPYLDIPFQHASPEVLKAMKRPAAQEKTLARIKSWRAQCPELALRSTFIVGFPGETDSDFAELLDWLEEAEIDRLGCFKYEPVRGAPANVLGPVVPDEIKQERWNALMARQQKISARRLKRKVGTRQQVIIDEVGPTVARGVQKPTRRRSTARSISPAADRSRSARSSRRRSSGRTNTTCTVASPASKLDSGRFCPV
jgi:ribosomal protein S12 methylthiotransferase